MHSVICHSPGSASASEDAEVEVDLHDGQADVVVTGTVGRRATSVLRTVFEALDGAPGPVRLDCRSARGSADAVRGIVDDARLRRRRRGLADVTLATG